jgi:hypothetical protein
VVFGVLTAANELEWPLTNPLEALIGASVFGELLKCLSGPFTGANPPGVGVACAVVLTAANPLAAVLAGRVSPFRALLERGLRRGLPVSGGGAVLLEICG